MKRVKVRKYQMLARAADFLAKYVSFFPSRTVAPEVLTRLTTAVQTLAGLLAVHVAHNSAIRVAFKTRRAAHDGLFRQLELICLSARALRFENFELPGKTGDHSLIDTGRAFVTAAEPLKQEFIQQGLPVEFIDNLNTAVRDLEAAVINRSSTRASRSGSIQEFDKVLEQGMGDFLRLEALVANTMSDNPSVMAAWNSASRVERTTVAKAPAEADTGAETRPAAPQTAACVTA
jgi:hypothetical protein